MTSSTLDYHDHEPQREATKEAKDAESISGVGVGFGTKANDAVATVLAEGAGPTSSGIALLGTQVNDAVVSLGLLCSMASEPPSRWNHGRLQLKVSKQDCQPTSQQLELVGATFPFRSCSPPFDQDVVLSTANKDLAEVCKGAQTTPTFGLRGCGKSVTTHSNSTRHFWARRQLFFPRHLISKRRCTLYLLLGEVVALDCFRVRVCEETCSQSHSNPAVLK